MQLNGLGYSFGGVGGLLRFLGGFVKQSSFFFPVRDLRNRIKLLELMR